MSYLTTEVLAGIPKGLSAPPQGTRVFLFVTTFKKNVFSPEKLDTCCVYKRREEGEVRAVSKGQQTKKHEAF